MRGWESRLGALLLLVSCRSGTHAEPAAAIVRQLRSHPRGASLLAEAPEHRVVFAHEAGVSINGIVRLERARSVHASAARYAHLLLHLRRGMPFDDAERGDCEARLLRAAAREEEALTLENELRRAWGLAGLPPSSLDDRVAAYRGRCR